jgi:signal peptidase I
LFVNRFIYGSQETAFERALLPGREVRRGDIVIFRSPEDPKIDLVKRCVALGGDTVEMRNKELFVNGQQVDDDAYIQHTDRHVHPRQGPFSSELRRRDNWGPLEVPAQDLWCMGDNRDQSWDSRYFGPVPRNLVKGRAEVIYWSYGGETPDGSWPGWGARIRQLANTGVGFFTKTRWGRTFRLVR